MIPSKHLLCLTLLALLFIGIADAKTVSELSDIAEGAQGFTDFVDGLVKAAAIVIGLAFLFSAMIKYQKYRKGSLEVRLGKIIVLVVLGGLLLLFPQIPRFLDKQTAFTVSEKGIVVPKVKQP